MQTPFARIGLPRLRRGGSREDKTYAAFAIALLWIVMLGIVPMVIAMAIGLAQGTIAEDVETAAPGYPAFPVLSTGLLIPALLLAFLFIRTFTWPLKDLADVGRGDIAWLSFVGFGVLVVGTSLDTNFLAPWAAALNLFGLMLYLAVCLFALARMAAGKLRLVPRSWREEPAKPKRRRRP